MTDSRIFTLRPLPKPTRNDESFRIYLSASSLAYLKLRPNDLCSLRLESGVEKTAIAWNAVGDVRNAVVQTSNILQECYGIKLGDKLTISKLNDEPSSLNEIDTVQLEECTDPEKLSTAGLELLSDKIEVSHWEWALEHTLKQWKTLSTSLTIEAVVKGQNRSFKVVAISNQSPTNHTISQFTDNSRVRIGGNESSEERRSTLLKVVEDGLGGLSDQICQLNTLLVDFNLQTHGAQMPQYYKVNRGILIHGQKGTGKTSLLHRIEAAGWKRQFTIGTNVLSRNSGDGEAKLRKIFKEASQAQPSVIIIDQIDSIAPKRASPDILSLAHALCESIDALGTAKVLVVAATRHPNDVDDSLRTPNRLSVEVEVSIPTAAARKQILCAIRDGSSQPSDLLIDYIAEKTHGYVGADLFALLQTTCRIARDRQLADGNSADPEVSVNDEDQKDSSSEWLKINEGDIVAAMQEVRPTAMREVFLETPQVKWTDIGGQHALKRHLQKMVERPLKVRLLLDPRRHVLLFILIRDL